MLRGVVPKKLADHSNVGETRLDTGPRPSTRVVLRYGVSVCRRSSASVVPMSSSSAPASAPLRASSKRTKSDHHTPPASHQSDLKESLSKEIRNHTWEFNAERIARMLSTANKGPPVAPIDSAHKAPGKVSPVWPTVDAEQPWYFPLAVFLNSCVDACHQVLDEYPGSMERDSYVYDRLKFIEFDKPMVDGVEGASPVKPDLVGGLDLEPNERVAWSPQGSSIKQALIPVEVKANWAPIIIQAATYARCLFSASPSRQFSVALGFRHIETELRFLVFHRGGLTGSKACSVKDPQDQKDILRIFLSILQWKSANDAGFLEFFNNSEMCLPRHEDDETGTVANVTEVLHDGLCLRGCASRVLLMSHPTGEGTKSEPPIVTLNPTIRTREGPKTGSQTKQEAKQGDKESRMSFHP